MAQAKLDRLILQALATVANGKTDGHRRLSACLRRVLTVMDECSINPDIDTESQEVAFVRKKPCCD